MPLKIVRKLQAAPAKKRKKILARMRRKNQAYFEQLEGGAWFSELLKTSDVTEYEIRMNDTFLDIVEKKSGMFCHPPGDLLGQADKLANPYHSDWTSVIRPLHENFGKNPHGYLVDGFIDRLYEGCAEIGTRLLQGDLTLPVMEDGRLHSGPVVFLGVFHGLHILSFLDKVSPSRFAILEPDVESFLLSCYFIDYELLVKKFRLSSLNVGDDVAPHILDSFIEQSPITSRVWLRFLPVYRDQRFADIVEQVKLRGAAYQNVEPYHREVNGLVQGAINIGRGYRYCGKGGALPSLPNVAVVGSGPSLKNDLEWLRNNQDRLFIIAAFSTAKILVESGIFPDLQIFVETVRLGKGIEGYFQKCPVVAYYSADPGVVENLANPILFVEENRPNSAHFLQPLLHTHPTSANTAMSIASLFKPQNLFLVGVDLSNRLSPSADHPLERRIPAYRALEQFLVEKTNFPESAGLLSVIGYWGIAKVEIEAAIQELGGNTTVYNLSDGVFFEGALPARSETVSVAGNSKPTHEQVLQFFPLMTSEDWEPYKEAGGQLLARMKRDVLEVFAGGFGWDSFSNDLDLRLIEVLEKYADPQGDDLRMNVFCPLIKDVVCEWYRAMIYAETPEELDLLYANGKGALRECLQGLQWPEELDALSFEKNV